MRSRPKIDLLLTPAVAAPGARLVAETVLTATSETPIDFVAMRLTSKLYTAAAAGKSQLELASVLLDSEWRSKPTTLWRGEHRYRVAFELSDTLPATYAGPGASIDHVLGVHVSIPWWPDRIETFTVPIKPRASPAAPLPRPQFFASSPDGPRGNEPFMEVALETTQLAVGDVLSGSISLQNLRGRRIRGLEVALVEIESVRPTFAPREARRHVFHVSDVAPPEGQAVPFAVRLPDGSTPAFRAGALEVTSYLEVRAIVAWGPDILVRPPLVVTVPTSSPRATRGWVAPVGRERRALVWQRVSERAALSSAPDAERIQGRRGAVDIEIRSEQRDGDFWLVAKLAWPSLGLDLDVGERRWSDLLSLDVVKTGDAQADARFAVHAREHVQARAVVAVDLMTALLRFEDVKLGDASATLASRGTAHATEPVEAFVAAALHAVDAIAVAAARVPPPAALASHLLAWRAFADRLRGRLELGRMVIHDGVVDGDRVTVGTEWTRDGLVVGTCVRVPVDPPLQAPPTSPDDVALSPAARETWRALVASPHVVHVERDAIRVEMEGLLADPSLAMPIVELAVCLRRALTGLAIGGPFR